MRHIKIDDKMEFPEVSQPEPLVQDDIQGGIVYSRMQGLTAMQVLDMTPFVDCEAEEEEEAGSKLYDLYAVLIHSGGALGGHYYSYIRDVEVTARE